MTHFSAADDASEAKKRMDLNVLLQAVVEHQLLRAGPQLRPNQRDRHLADAEVGDSCVYDSIAMAGLVGVVRHDSID